MHIADMVAGFYARAAQTMGNNPAPPLIRPAVNSEWGSAPVDGVRDYPPQAFPYVSRITGKPVLAREFGTSCDLEQSPELIKPSRAQKVRKATGKRKGSTRAPRIGNYQRMMRHSQSVNVNRFSY